GAELLLVRCCQSLRTIFEGVLCRPCLALFEDGETMRRHTVKLDQLFRPPDVDLAPVGARLARSEADGIERSVNALADAVNPSRTERLIERLLIGHGVGTGFPFVETDPEFADTVVILLQPGTELLL